MTFINEMAAIPKTRYNSIYPCLWFNGNAKEAAEFYCSVFADSAVMSESPLVVTFESAGQKFMCLNGGPEFSFNSAISFYVVCETEYEINSLWEKLLQNGSALMPIDRYDWSKRYGWLKDRFGVNWQLTLGRVQDVGRKFSPVLMFTGKLNGKAEQAIKFYTTIFEGSSVSLISRYSKGENEMEEAINHAQFNLGKHVFIAMDSSLDHKVSFNESVSFVVECNTQEEIDYYWGKLTDGGKEVQCGWLKDKYGISWQIVPAILGELMSDPSRSERIIKAFLKMKKLDIKELINA